MGGLVLGLLVGYIVGGVSFIPLLIWGLWTWGTRNPSSNQAYKSRQAYASQDLPEREVDDDLGEWGAGLGEDLLRELKAKHVPDVASGYFAICREYVPGGVNGKPPDRNTAATNTMLAMESPSVYQSMYRSIFDRSRNSGPTLSPSPTPSKNKKTRNVFYVVLRLGHLMLYDDAAQLEVRHVISLVHYSISVYAGGEEIPEGELWIKRNCIRLIPRDSASAVGDARSFYFFSDNCSEKEDFYHAMLRSQESQFHPGPSSTPPPPLKFNPADLIKLVQQLHASEENLHTRWINALIGRLFLALYKTAHIENYIRNKVTKKIDRVQKPSLIRSIKVQKLDMGDLPPFLTNPKLKELTVDGDLTVEADVSYKGNFRIDISAVARIELGSRFKPREVTFILATILKSLEGHVLIRIKPPPSNRLWVTFETPPKMELSLEPIVSSRQITYGVILRAIESRIREVVNETLVFPNWDDMPFSSTHSHLFRGGIWEDEASLGQESHAPPGLMTVSTPEDVHAETRSIPDTIYSSSNESTKSMPALGSSALRQRKPVPSGAIEQNSSTAYGGRMGNSEPASAHYKLTSPRHSSSTYADLAIPTVDTDMAYSDHILMST
ncbi:hypothetical protein BU23DRAFT_559770 [Bimuria novae-zelandiae CBS 107.79]|uniref:SMP-LTD domain-containing protein n=1 Tax=Bimuria novae-zelandiae CBS 107.79 TaxID=1447943 RepID=A0A6A5UVI5_9PLEO|nr:hypothetical protein BU23DRAFT_559770 [Bimuria novae-zelandiae CBS 107.79]